MSFLKLKNIEKKFGDFGAIKGIDLEISPGEFIVFVGPSGCGKSTLLRLIAGLEKIDQGTVILQGKDITDESPAKRNLAMVFQSYALYPHMNVYENMSFSLRLAKVNKKVIRDKVEKAAEILNLTSYLKRFPKELSGGQRQRVAIGRAIVREPLVFLFDEPLSNLDAALRTQTRLEIHNLHRSLNSTTIYVTHDQVEAMTLADRVVVLRNGVVEQVGTPLELFDHPINQFVAEFIGIPKMNIFSIEKIPASIRKDIESYLKKKKISSSQLDKIKTIGFRPEAVVLMNSKNSRLSGLTSSKKKSAALTSPVSGVVNLIEHLGVETLVFISAGEINFVDRESERMLLRLDDKIKFSIDLERIHFFDQEEKTIKF